MSGNTYEEFCEHNMGMKKSDHELLLLNYIKEKGLVGYSQMQGEGRNYNKVYFCFNLENGEQRFWTDPSEEFKRELGIEL